MKYGLEFANDDTTTATTTINRTSIDVEYLDNEVDIEEILPTLQIYDPTLSPEKRALLTELKRALEAPDESHRTRDEDNWRMIKGIRQSQLANEQIELERQKLLKHLIADKMQKVELSEQQFLSHTVSSNGVNVNNGHERDKKRELVSAYETRVERIRAAVEAKYDGLARDQKQIEMKLTQQLDLEAERQRKLQQEAAEKARKERELVAEEQKAKQAMEEEQRARQERQELKEQKARQEAEEQSRKEKVAHQRELDQQQLEQSAAETFGDPAAISNAHRLVAQLKEVKEVHDRDIKANRAMLNVAVKYRMTFRKKVGAVTSSKSHIIEFSREIGDVLNHGKNLSQPFYLWLLNNLAKQFVKQAEEEVAANMKKAFPIAFLACLLCTQHPQLIEYLLGRLFKKCQYAVPMYPRRLAADTDEQFVKKMGYKVLSGGKIEDESRFVERMKGMLALYAAFMQTDLSPFQQLENPYAMGNAWTFITRLLNMKPRKISATLVETFFKVSGVAFMQRYPRQGVKVVEYVRDHYMPRLNNAPAGDKVRLELMLDHYFQHQHSFEDPDGRQLSQ